MTDHDDHDDYMDRLCELYEKGDKPAILLGLEYCINNNRPIPQWLATALRDAFRKVRMFEVKSWDDVFGRHLKKGKRLATERRNMQIAGPLFEMIRERHEAGTGIGRPLFNAVGAEFGISGTVASELYYEVIKELGGTIEPSISGKI
jgi:hypothetical protein